MNKIASSREIVEFVEELECDAGRKENTQDEVTQHWQKYSIEDDINKLFEAVVLRNAHKMLGPSENSKDALSKSAMKRPVRVGSAKASGIGISESVTLKQALRGLCISQASEMAAVKKRLSKSSLESGASEAETTKRLYRAVVVETSESANPLPQGKGNLMEIALVPESSASSSFIGNVPIAEHIFTIEESNFNSNSSPPSHAPVQKTEVSETLTKDEIVPLSTAVYNDLSDARFEQEKKVVSLIGTSTDMKLPMLHELAPATTEVPIVSKNLEEQKGKVAPASCSSIVTGESKTIKSASRSPQLMKPLFRGKNFVKSKILSNMTSLSSRSTERDNGATNDLGGSTSKVVSQTPDLHQKNGLDPESSGSGGIIDVSSRYGDYSAWRPAPNSHYWNKTRNIVSRSDDKSRSREKGENSRSSKSSIGDYSSTTSFSEESCVSGSSRSSYRPHMSKDLRWKAINCIQKQHVNLGLKHFKLLRKLGGGDIGNVYLCELIGTNCLFSMKVTDNDFLESRKKMARAQTEKEILQMLDHPFLPSLYAHFKTDKFSCLVMEYCAGGDLHVLRQKQPSKSFSERAARFYASEILLALEYLHMLGVVYRDLKPENVLVREDGHIMLTDFDLSLRCAVNLTLLKSSLTVDEQPEKMSSSCSESSCIDPFCLQPSWQVSCFNPKFLSAGGKTNKLKTDQMATQVGSLPQLIVEPTSARSNSFVGTHEYLAPEIIKGEGHGSAVDWWTLGIFLYELLYGRTPFKGPMNEDTLSNVVSLCLKFPEFPLVSSNARDLITRLLTKEPKIRLGSEKGAAEIKQHPFFEGLNWALIRCTTPPEMPDFPDLGNLLPDNSSQVGGKRVKDCRTIEEDIVFEMF